MRKECLLKSLVTASVSALLCCMLCREWRAVMTRTAALLNFMDSGDLSIVCLPAKQLIFMLISYRLFFKSKYHHDPIVGMGSICHFLALSDVAEVVSEQARASQLCSSDLAAPTTTLGS